MNKEKCPNCGNTNKCDLVYKCHHCYKIYCEECAGEGIIDTTCPECGDSFAEKLFEI